jgi:hypothetical protein
MSIKDHALLVSLNVGKPQLTAKDAKATFDAELANNASGAGQYRKDLYPKSLVAPILAVESAARAYIENTTYPWNRGENLLPVTRFMEFTDRIGKYQIEFDQAVTAFLNNWTGVMAQAQTQQGDLFDVSTYPDVSDLRSDFRFRIAYRPVTDAGDFRVQLQEDDLNTVRAAVEEQVRESTNEMLRAPLERLRSVVARLHEVAGKTDRVVDGAKGVQVKAPIFRDSVVENISEEIALLHDFADMLPDTHVALAKQVADALPHPQQLRDDPTKRAETRASMGDLLAQINGMLGE